MNSSICNRSVQKDQLEEEYYGFEFPIMGEGEPKPVSKNRKYVRDAARFAVQVYNDNQQMEFVEFKRVVKAGKFAIFLNITIESKEGKLYQADVRMYDTGFELDSFEPVVDNPMAVEFTEKYLAHH